MTYMVQDQWNWMVAVYLFLGGMGAMVMAIVTAIHRFKIYGQENTKLMVWGNLTGFVMLSIGSALLFYHLLDHLAVWHVLFGIFTKPDAWISWGTWSIIIGMMAGLVYALPHFEIPKMGWCRLLRFAKWWGKLTAGILAWTTIVASVFTAVYTGLLLQSFVAVELWHNPGVPVLFTLSATSTALATLLLLQYLVVKADDHPLRHLFEVTDAWLISAEIIVVIGFFFFMLDGSEGGQVSHNLLWGSAGWLYGFFVLGLIVPLLVNLGNLTGKFKTGTFGVLMSAVLVLIGGYLLRHYFLAAGVWELPWK